MKKILVISFIFIGFISRSQTYNPVLHTVTNKALGISQANPTDARSYFYDATNFVYRPYISTAEVLTYLNLAKYRVGQFDIVVNTGGSLSGGVITGGTNAVWYFKNGTADSNLVQKIFGASSTDSSIFATRYYVDTAKLNLRAAIAGKLQNTLATGKIWAGDLSGNAAQVVPGGDVTMTSGGSFTVLNQIKPADTAAMLSPYLRKIDTTNKWVTSIYRKIGSDSVFYIKGGVSIFGFIDSTGGSGGGGITSLNGLTAGTQTFATGTSGTDFGISSVSSTHTFNLPIASGTNTGKLSNTDWTTFNNKQPAGSYITSLTTDVVATGPGIAAATIQPLAVTTGKINTNAVTYAKIQAASGQALLGATGAGNYQEITLGTNLSMAGSVLNATGGGGSVTVRDSLSYINGAKFGMIGDGTTDNTTILQALINAGYRSIYVPKGVYIITAIQMKDSVTIWGDGRQNSIFKLTGNTTAFTCSAALGGTKCEFWNIGFQGTFGGTGNSGQKAIVLDTVNGCYVNNVGGYFLGGFLVTVKGNAFIAGNGFTFGNIISNCYTETCGGSGGGGVLLDTRAEYNKVIGCSFSDGGVGVQSNGGNNLISDNDLSTNGWGIYLGAGSNDGHGIASNNTMNHCSYGVYIDGITLGYTFTGNHIYACVTDAVFINNSTGIYFTGGTIDGNASSPLMSVTSSSNISFNMVRFPTAPTWTTTSSTGISIISSMTNMSGINIIDPFHSSKNSTIATADGVVTFNTFSGGEYDFDKTVVLAGAAADLTRSFCAVSARLDGGSSGPTDLFQVYRTGTTGSSMAILDNAANYSFRAMPSGKIGLGNNSTPAVSLVTASTDAWGVPNGTSAQRPTGAAAYVRYNSDSLRFEGNNGSGWKCFAWTSDAGGGGGSDTLKVVNAGIPGARLGYTGHDTLYLKSIGNATTQSDSTIQVNTIYTADGTINGSRTITGGTSPNVTWNGFNTFSVNTSGLISLSGIPVRMVGGVQFGSMQESGAGTLTLDNQSVWYVFTGTTTTWTLPDRASNPRQIYYIKNAGSGNITLNRAGSDQIYDTSAVTSLTITPGSAIILVAGTSYWYKQ
jgi:hypothetical protein